MSNDADISPGRAPARAPWLLSPKPPRFFGRNSLIRPSVSRRVDLKLIVLDEAAG